MAEEIKLRRYFDDVDVLNTAYIRYEPYNERPKDTDFKYGERRSIVLRNRATQELERIEYVLSGAIPRSSYENDNRCISFWGDIQADGPHCCLVFDFDLSTGDCNAISGSFCGRSMSYERDKELSKKATFAAEVTSIYNDALWKWRKEKDGNSNL